MAKPRLLGMPRGRTPDGQRIEGIEELGSAAAHRQLRHANRCPRGPWPRRVSVTPYPPLGPNPAAELPVGASSPLLHGMIRPQQRRGLRPIYFIYPHEAGPIPLSFKMSPLYSSLRTGGVCVLFSSLDSWTKSPLLPSAVSSRDDGKPSFSPARHSSTRKA